MNLIDSWGEPEWASH